MEDALGLHLVTHIDLVDSPRRSVVARLDGTGRLTDLGAAATDDEVTALTDVDGAGALVVDAPLVAPDATGRRDVEAVLAWCDVAAFPVSSRRLQQVTGGMRGVGLAPALAHDGRVLAEGLPDLVLRQIAWEATHPLGDAPLDLADYRHDWIGVRAPRYRPKGVGRAHPAGTLAAWELLSGVVDLDGWHPTPGGDDWAAIHDAAVIDAVCCAWAGLRVLRGDGLLLGTPARGVVAVPAAADLRGRVEATLTRLRSDGSVAI